MKIDNYLKASPVFQIYMLMENVFTPFQNELKEQGVTFIQSLILTSMYFEGGAVNPSNLSKTLKTSPSNVSHSLRYLTSSGLLQKVLNSDDARKVDLKLTSKGKKKALRLISFFDDTQESFEDEMTEKAILSWNSRANDLIDCFHRSMNE